MLTKALYCNGSENEYADYYGLFKSLTRKEFTLKWNRKDLHRLCMKYFFMQSVNTIEI